MNQNVISLKNEPLASIVIKNFRAADVFKKYGIDFCCGGKISLKDACNKAGIDLAKLENELKNIINKSFEEDIDFSIMKPDELIDYIISVHHKYVEENIPALRDYTFKISSVHKDTNPELEEICSLFFELADELEHHMMKEEKILFPYIKHMVNPAAYPESNGCTHFGSVQNPVSMMEQEHENAGAAFKKIRRLSNNYNLPPHACNTYIVAYKMLQEFEDDLHKHIHLENNILFPAAIEWEVKF